MDALYDGERALPRRRDGAHRGGRHPLRRLGLRAAADHAGRDRRGRGPARHRRSGRWRSGSAACSTSSTRSRTTCCTFSRPTRGRRGRCRSCPRRRRSRWPRRPPGSCSAPPSTELRTEGLLPSTGDGGDLPADAPIAVKEAVLPFHRFRSAGRQRRRHPARAGDEVDRRGDGHRRRVRARRSRSPRRPRTGRCRPAGRSFVSVANRDKRAAIFPIKRLADLGFRILATEGTALVLRRHGVPVEIVAQATGGARPSSPTACSGSRTARSPW